MSDEFSVSWSASVSSSTGEHLASASVSDMAVVMHRVTGRVDNQYPKALAMLKGLPSAEQKSGGISGEFWVASTEDVWNRLVKLYGEQRLLAIAPDWATLVTRSRDYCERHEVILGQLEVK
jgi:hypothetical protein